MWERGSNSAADNVCPFLLLSHPVVPNSLHCPFLSLFLIATYFSITSLPQRWGWKTHISQLSNSPLASFFLLFKLCCRHLTVLSFLIVSSFHLLDSCSFEVRGSGWGGGGLEKIQQWTGVGGAAWTVLWTFISMVSLEWTIKRTLNVFGPWEENQRFSRFPHCLFYNT